MDITSSKITISTAHCGPTRKLRLSGLMLLCQEEAILDVTRRGVGMSEMMNKGYLWVVAKQHYEIKRMPRYEEEVTVQTYPGKLLAAFFIRHYRILDDKGEVLVKGVSIWALIDEKTRSIVSPAKAGVAFEPIEMEDELPFPSKYVFPELNSQTKIAATYSKCDVNGHINNTVYFDLAEDCIPFDFLKSHDIKTIDIAYKKEMRLGESLPMSYGYEAPYYYFHSDKFEIRLGY